MYESQADIVVTFGVDAVIITLFELYEILQLVPDKTGKFTVAKVPVQLVAVKMM